MSFLSPLLRLSGLMAALLFVLAVLGFGAGLDGYAQARHPVALLGAHGVPHALAFNLLGFVLPGLLAAVVAERLRRRLPATAGWAPRVGSQMLLLAGLAFAAMGLLPLDVDDLHGPASQLHASAWMIWVLGFVAGTLLLGISQLRPAACWRRWRPLPCRACCRLHWRSVWPLPAGRCGWHWRCRCRPDAELQGRQCRPCVPGQRAVHCSEKATGPYSALSRDSAWLVASTPDSASMT